MREILFRGKRIDSGEWAYGTMYKIATDLNPFILTGGKSGCSYQVDEETVGQYTGLKDKNGKRIFEGDIVRYIETDISGDMICTDSVEFKEGCFSPIPTSYSCSDEYYSFEIHSFEVIGNITDNPELLEK